MSGAASADVVAVPRDKTALSRQDLSRPMRMALADSLLPPPPPGATVTDYGCGLGGDARHLTGLGYDCAAYNPAHAPDGWLQSSDVVNVIEDAAERAVAVKEAWRLTGRVLVVSARILGDGPGVFYVFRDVGERASFVASRFRRSPRPARVGTVAAAYAEHRALRRWPAPLGEHARRGNHHGANTIRPAASTVSAMACASRRRCMQSRLEVERSGMSARLPRVGHAWARPLSVRGLRAALRKAHRSRASACGRVSTFPTSAAATPGPGVGHRRLDTPDRAT